MPSQPHDNRKLDACRDVEVDTIDFTRVAEDLVRKHDARMAQVAEAVDRSRDPGEKQKQRLTERVRALRDGRFPPRLVESLAGGIGAGRAHRMTPALSHAEAFLAGSKTVLVLTGGTGAGKTFAAMWIGHEAGGPRPGFVRSSSLERVGRYDKEHQDWLDVRTMLVLDDVGTEYMDGKGAFLSLLDELVDKAWGDKTRLVITTNMEGKGLRDRLGERIWSRIVDVGTVGPCGAEDLRRLR